MLAKSEVLINALLINTSLLVYWWAYNSRDDIAGFKMGHEAILLLAAEDMAEVNEIILAQLSSDVSLVNGLGSYLIGGRGKRLRPLLVLLSAKALGYTGTKHTVAAAFVEFIHTATLLHDDVVDESDFRRGKKTANKAFGNAASILVGDYIYTRSFQMMTQLGSLRVLELMSETVNVIAEGEVRQLANCNNPDVTEASYMRIVRSKTAKLFAAAAQVSAILSNAPADIERTLKRYGRHVGTAFQLIDDVMDYTSNIQSMGKKVGDDLSKGKITLPLLHALRNGTSKQSTLIRDAISSMRGMDYLDEILSILEKTGSIGYAKKKAEEESEKAVLALSLLPDNVYKSALEALARLAVARTK